MRFLQTKLSLGRLIASGIIAGVLYKWLWDTYLAIDGSPNGIFIYFFLVMIVYLLWEFGGGK